MEQLLSYLSGPNIRYGYMFASSMLMGYYSALCQFYPKKGLSLLTGGNVTTGSDNEFELTSRLGILYNFGTVSSFIILSMNNDYYNKLLCAAYGIYLANLAILTRSKPTFWDKKAFIKNSIPSALSFLCIFL